jgi:NADH-quinone oxidoreductase subunit N
MPGRGGYDDLVAGWVPILVVVAALSIILGNLAALAQQSVRRLLAYSAIGQAGYVLIGLCADTTQGLASVLFYAITYAFTALGAFAVVGWVQTRTGREDIAAFAGLSRRAPVVSFGMLIFLLSLAGIPPLAGFFGKFYLFSAALGRDGGAQLGLLWLVILAVVMSAVSLYYYLQILKQIFVVEGPGPSWPASSPSVVPLVVGLLAAVVVLFGCLPSLLLDLLLPALKTAGF